MTMIYIPWVQFCVLVLLEGVNNVIKVLFQVNRELREKIVGLYKRSFYEDILVFLSKKIVDLRLIWTDTRDVELFIAELI